MSGFEADARGAKKRDYWFTVLLTDPVAVPLTNFLAKRRLMTPNQVTILSFFLGVSVGFFFATGERWGLIAGGLLFYLAFVTDCVDGKLARATGITSEKGQALDALADGARRASASLGMIFALHALPSVCPEQQGRFIHPVGCSGPGLTPVLLGIVYVVLAYYFLEISGAEKGEPAGGARGKWSQSLAKYRLLPNPGMPDVQAIVFIFGPVLGLVVPALIVGIAMVSVAILLTVRRRLR